MALPPRVVGWSAVCDVVFPDHTHLLSDCGTENSYLRFLQPFLRLCHQVSMADIKSFMYRKSTAHQRILAWLSYLKRQDVHWLINKLRYCQDYDRFCTFNPSHVEFLRLCLLDVLQAELDCIAEHLNFQNIRAQKMYNELPCAYSKLEFMEQIYLAFGKHYT